MSDRFTRREVFPYLVGGVGFAVAATLMLPEGAKRVMHAWVRRNLADTSKSPFDDEIELASVTDLAWDLVVNRSPVAGEYPAKPQVKLVSTDEYRQTAQEQAGYFGPPYSRIAMDPKATLTFVDYWKRIVYVDRGDEILASDVLTQKEKNAALFYLIMKGFQKLRNPYYNDALNPLIIRSPLLADRVEISGNAGWTEFIYVNKTKKTIVAEGLTTALSEIAARDSAREEKLEPPISSKFAVNAARLLNMVLESLWIKPEDFFKYTAAHNSLPELFAYLGEKYQVRNPNTPLPKPYGNTTDRVDPEYIASWAHDLCIILSLLEFEVVDYARALSLINGLLIPPSDEHRQKINRPLFTLNGLPEAATSTMYVKAEKNRFG